MTNWRSTHDFSKEFPWEFVWFFAQNNIARISSDLRIYWSKYWRQSKLTPISATGDWAIARFWRISDRKNFKHDHLNRWQKWALFIDLPELVTPKKVTLRSFFALQHSEILETNKKWRLYNFLAKDMTSHYDISRVIKYSLKCVWSNWLLIFEKLFIQILIKFQQFHGKFASNHTFGT